MSDASKRDIPDANLYRPLFSPWFGGGDRAFREIYEPIRPYSLVSSDRSYVLYTAARQAAAVHGTRGEWWECGVYKGGTAMLLAAMIERVTPDDTNKSDPITLRLFDTFAGMPETDAARDVHRRGDFADTDERAVRARVPQPFVRLHAGLIPQSFEGLERARVALAHVDVDIYSSVTDCCRFIYPRMLGGGFMIFDDYGFDTCPGARQAVDEFFEAKPEVPFVLPTGQALVCVAPRAASLAAGVERTRGGTLS
jgi:O-methyltransferase